eukprot:7281716-Karenia_brevis.AAC.1
MSTGKKQPKLRVGQVRWAGRHQHLNTLLCVRPMRSCLDVGLPKRFLQKSIWVSGHWMGRTTSREQKGSPKS